LSLFRQLLSFGIEKYVSDDLEHIDKPFNTEIINLMNEEGIKSIIPHQLREGLHIVRKTGNNAVHYGNRITSQDALLVSVTSMILPSGLLRITVKPFLSCQQLLTSN
jgi:hypothetical protein